MNKYAKLREVMTEQVITVKPTDTMARVDEIFNTHHIHHLPVVDDDGKVVGIISKTDYYKMQHGLTMFHSAKSEEYNQALFHSILVEDVMTKQVATLHPDDTVATAAAYFRENLFHAIPIVDEHKRLVGIVTTYDLLNYAFKEDAYLPPKVS